jgi:hypothetical protein
MPITAAQRLRHRKNRRGKRLEYDSIPLTVEQIMERHEQLSFPTIKNSFGVDDTTCFNADCFLKGKPNKTILRRGI